MKLSVFDLDGTLVHGGSERAFFRYLAANRRLGPRQLASFAVGFARYLPAAGIHVAKKNKAYLAGLRTDEVEALAAEFAPHWLRSHWVEPAVQRLKQCQRRGEQIWLLSGTPDFLLKPVAAELGVRNYCGSLPASHDGVYRSALPALHPFGDAKATLVAKIATQFCVKWRDIAAYGDSIYDVPLLARVGEAVVVNPDRRLRAVAVARGWEIIEAQRTSRSLRVNRSTD